MEALQIQKTGSVQIDDVLDKNFKPGLFNQVAAFLKGHFTPSLSISEQLDITSVYYKMAGYND